MIKCLENLLKKLGVLKCTQPTQSSLAIINLLIIRDTFTEESTIGKLFLNGERMCVQDVPNRDWILFHRGNSAKDTSGCILVGLGSQQDLVKNSRLAMDLLVKEILNLGGTNINLIIKNK